jgi:hypothetical protein
MSLDDAMVLGGALEPLAGEELERLFARYARVRLEPNPAQVRRARIVVMEVAWRARIAGQQQAAGARNGRLAGARTRRLVVSVVAAVFVGLAVGSSVFAASRAGGPLYSVRIAIEDATLPSDPAARIQGEIAHAQMRLAEAYEAEVRGDAGAMTAALSAYEAEAATLGATTGGPAEQALAAIQQHRSVLLALIERASAASLAGLDRALAGSDQAIERLTTTNAGEGSGHGNEGQEGSPNGLGGASGGNGGTGGNGGAGGNTGTGGGATSGGGSGQRRRRDRGRQRRRGNLSDSSAERAACDAPPRAHAAAARSRLIPEGAHVEPLPLPEARGRTRRASASRARHAQSVMRGAATAQSRARPRATIRRC